MYHSSIKLFFGWTKGASDKVTVSQPVAKQNCVGINISEGRILKLGTLLLRGTCFYLSNAIYTCILQTQCKKNNIETW